MRTSRIIRSATLLALVLFAILVVPVPARIRVPVFLQAEQARFVYVTAPGMLRHAAKAGQQVSTGQVIAELENGYSAGGGDATRHQTRKCGWPICSTRQSAERWSAVRWRRHCVTSKSKQSATGRTSADDRITHRRYCASRTQPPQALVGNAERQEPADVPIAGAPADRYAALRDQ
jgi:hypothetical protein